MGLRSLYTILSKAASDLEYLEPAVAVVLGFIGSKMIAEYFGYEIATEVALAFVASILSGGIALSIWSRNNRTEEAEKHSVICRFPTEVEMEVTARILITTNKSNSLEESLSVIHRHLHYISTRRCTI